MDFGLHAVQVVDEIFLIRHALEESGFVIAGQRLSSGRPRIAVDKGEVARQNAVDLWNVAAYDRIFYFLFERLNLCCGAGFRSCGGQSGLLGEHRGNRNRRQKEAESQKA